MKAFHIFLAWIYKLNSHYDQMPRAKRGNMFAVVSVVFMMNAAMLPMVFSYILGKNMSDMTLGLFLTTVVVAALFRIPYLKGKLNKYMPVTTYVKKEVGRQFASYLNQFTGYTKIKEAELIRKADAIFGASYNLNISTLMILNEQNKKYINEQIYAYMEFLKSSARKLDSESYKENDNFFNSSLDLNKRISYLKILGLDISATDEQIKSTYRKLAMKLHPDRNPGNKQAEEKFKEMKSAYESLC